MSSIRVRAYTAITTNSKQRIQGVCVLCTCDSGQTEFTHNNNRAWSSIVHIVVQWSNCHVLSLNSAEAPQSPQKNALTENSSTCTKRSQARTFFTV